MKKVMNTTLWVCALALTGVLRCRCGGVVWVGLGAQLFIFENTYAEKMDEDWSQRLKDLNERYEDYYRQRIMREKALRALLQSANDYRKQREENLKQWELKRKKYILEKKIKSSLAQEEKEYWDQKKKEEQKYEEMRKKFVHQRDKILEQKKSSKQIPEEEESGIVNPLENFY